MGKVWVIAWNPILTDCIIAEIIIFSSCHKKLIPWSISSIFLGLFYFFFGTGCLIPYHRTPTSNIIKVFSKPYKSYRFKNIQDIMEYPIIIPINFKIYGASLFSNLSIRALQ